MGDAFRVGLGGPVGAGKTSLTASLCKVFSDTLSMAVITNDIYTKEDAEILMKKQVIDVNNTLNEIKSKTSSSSEASAVVSSYLST